MDSQEQHSSMLSTRELALLVNEQCRSREPGDFYRYMSVDALHSLYTEGQIIFDGKTAYTHITSSEKFNPSKLDSCSIFAYYFINAVDDYLCDVPGWKRDMHERLLQSDRITLNTEFEQIERSLVQLDERFAGLKVAFDKAIEDEDTTPCIEYFKRTGGEQVMMSLERAGWDVYPNGAFSDLFPVSVGAPLFLSGTDKIVIAEMNFSRDELSIPDTDHNNEHEVMVRRITLENLTHVYTSETQGELWFRLQQQYPTYFTDKGYSALSDFARKKSLTELLQEIGVI